MIVGDGRPLRFLGLVAGGWVALRVAIVWQATGSLPQAIRGALPVPQIAAAAVARPDAPPVSAGAGRWPVAIAVSSRPIASVAASPVKATPPDAVRVQLALLAMTRFGEVAPAQVIAGSPFAPPVRDTPSPGGPAAPSRLSISSWLVARGATGLGTTALSPQLGGTQGGLRVDYALSRGLAATARLAAPAAGAGREVSLGLAWRPKGVPLRFVAEQRIAIDGGRGGPALGVSGGVSELPLPGGLRVDGYAQAGTILRRGLEHYVDGSVRAARPVAELAGIALDAGGGAWGGAQRGVARFDIGPSIGARVSLGNRALRLSLDWRQRVAGGARPGSGPALTLGTDF
ncbi:MAG: hypothetical protein V4537_07330 [Pseudomonadota bacterium]